LAHETGVVLKMPDHRRPGIFLPESSSRRNETGGEPRERRGVTSQTASDVASLKQRRGIHASYNDD